MSGDRVDYIQDNWDKLVDRLWENQDKVLGEVIEEALCKNEYLRWRVIEEGLKNKEMEQKLWDRVNDTLPDDEGLHD